MSLYNILIITLVNCSIALNERMLTCPNSINHPMFSKAGNNVRCSKPI